MSNIDPQVHHVLDVPDSPALERFKAAAARQQQQPQAGDLLQIYYAAHVEGIGWQVPVWNGAVAGTTDQGLRMEALAIMITGNNSSITASAYVQDLGWLNDVTGTDGRFIVVGTTGKSLRMEALKISAVSGTICAKAHVQNIGWQEEICNRGDGSFIVVGTETQSLRMEAISLLIVS